jgi:Uma2 family endonuclease
MTVATVGRMTLQEFLTYDDDSDRRYELVDGVLVEMANESTGNTKIALFLIEIFFQLVGRQNLGIKQKIEVRSRYVTARDADLIIHTEDSADAIEERSEACLFLSDPNPQVVFEIVSPGDENTLNYQRDYEHKPREYADREIPEMWQIDPVREWIRVGTLIAGEYQFETFMGDNPIVSPSLPNFNLTATQVLVAGKRPQRNP